MLHVCWRALQGLWLNSSSGKPFWKTNIFFVFSREATERQKQRILPKKDSSTESTRRWIFFFLECRAENISGEAFCEGNQTRNLLNGSIQILDGIMRQFCEFINLWVESTSKKKTKTQASLNKSLPPPNAGDKHVAWITGLTKLALGFLGCTRHLYLGHLKEFFDFPLVKSAHVVDISLETKELFRGWTDTSLTIKYIHTESCSNILGQFTKAPTLDRPSYISLWVFFNHSISLA